MAERSFSGPDGTPWQAWDVVPGQHSDWPAHARQHLPEAMSEGWVCFECDEEKRRLHPIPEGWETLGDEELWALCRDAEPVKRRLTADSPVTAGSAAAESAAEAQPAAG
jgi:hypothetical protein